MMQIREVRETDDFEAIYDLVNRTLRKHAGEDNVTYGVTADELKRNFCGSNPNGRAFVAVTDGELQAYMSVYISEVTNNGIVECGYKDENVGALGELLDCCVSFIKKHGGDKVYKYSPMRFGQVRNEGISLWERLGFISDEFCTITTVLDAKEWKAPDDFTSVRIEPAVEMQSADMIRILLEDGEEEMAELVQKQFTPGKDFDQVILTLLEERTNDIAGIAFYRVMEHEPNPGRTVMNAVAFGVHIRPKFELKREEIGRFVQGVLVSMKQLGVEQAITRVTLKHFDVFAAMVKEGFHNEGLENANMMRLWKRV